MVKTYCDGCNIDVTPHVKVWGIRIEELKKRQDSLEFHLCDECRKDVLSAVEVVIKTKARENGEDKA